jgi:hypothetical protein
MMLCSSRSSGCCSFAERAFLSCRIRRLVTLSRVRQSWNYVEDVVVLFGRAYFLHLAARKGGSPVILRALISGSTPAAVPLDLLIVPILPDLVR